MSDAAIVAALEALATPGDGSIDVEASSILAAGTEAEIAAVCVNRAKEGQVVALRALGDAGEHGRLTDLG